ncbi:MAG: DUF4438 domain-containing protein [Calditrichaeota bacterium]|jgi:hypothetical protein|nr:DUF4438 domain-containing protein [Calditrichota bacterium]
MNNIKTNRDKLIIQSVVGAIADPPMRVVSPYRISADGEPMVMPGTGGITYNAQIGDSAIDWWADHVEPGVTIRHADADRNSVNNGALQILACVGNKARIVTGDAKDDIGRITGKHGGVYHLMVDFPVEKLENMVNGDKMLIKSCGQGLAMTEFPEIKIMNLDPDLFEVMDLRGDSKTGKVRIPVTHTIPSAVMGSGLGHADTVEGDYDIQMFDPETVEQYKMNELRFGDIVAILDADHSFGRIYRKHSVSIGVVVHSRSVLAGHGPGVTTLFTSSKGDIDVAMDPNANLKNLFEKLKEE